MWFVPVAVIFVLTIVSCGIGALVYQSILTKCMISSQVLFERVFYVFPRSLSFSVYFLNPWIFTFLTSIFLLIAALITHNTGSITPASVYGAIFGFYGIYKLIRSFAGTNKILSMDDIIVSRARFVHIMHAMIIILSVVACYLVHLF